MCLSYSIVSMLCVSVLARSSLYVIIGSELNLPGKGHKTIKNVNLTSQNLGAYIQP